MLRTMLLDRAGTLFRAHLAPLAAQFLAALLGHLLELPE
jgi:hypothetical protein